VLLVHQHSVNGLIQDYRTGSEPFAHRFRGWAAQTGVDSSYEFLMLKRHAHAIVSAVFERANGRAHVFSGRKRDYACAAGAVLVA
jgi:hypothetical protein